MVVMLKAGHEPPQGSLIQVSLPFTSLIVRYLIGHTHVFCPNGRCSLEMETWSVQDYAEAMRWYRKAAEQGRASAQYNIASLYERGLGVTQDFAEAVGWYRKAAEQGYPSAQNNLGILYDHGRGVTQDFAEAVRWYRSAAEQGEAFAQYNLGNEYALGQGVTQDYVQAHKWYNLAAASQPEGRDRDIAVAGRH